MTATSTATTAPTLDLPPPPSLPPGGPPPRGLTDRPGRVLVLLVGGLMTLAVLAFGLFNIVTVIARDETTTTVSFPTSVRHLKIDVGRGDVTLIGQAVAERDGITGTRTVVQGLTAPTYREQVDGDTLTIESTCRALMGWCSVSYSLTVPTGAVVEVTSGSGDVHVQGVDGEVSLTSSSGDLWAESVDTLTARSSSGDITVGGADGAVVLSSQSGDISATGLGGATADAQASSGDVVLTFRAAPMEVDARTSSGDISLLVPNDGARYAVITDTSSGNVQVGVDKDPAGERRLIASTSSGDIVVTPHAR